MVGIRFVLMVVPAFLRRRWLGPLLVALALLPVALSGAPRETWRQGRTEHFSVMSSASERKTRQLMFDLEQFRASFIATFGLRPAHEPRVTVMLFDSDRLFTPYKPLYKGRPKDVSGYFIGDADEVVIALNGESGSDELGDPAETIFHEYVHLLLHTRGLRLPTWLNEGLAELYSTFRVNGDQVEFGRPKQDYVDLLNASATLPLARLMAVTEASPDYNEEHRVGMFYAQSWAFAHFLVCGEDRRNAERLGRFIGNVGRSGKSAEELFREIFGGDFAELDRTLRYYLQGGRYYERRAPVPARAAADALQLRPATEFERDFALLNLRWRVHRSGETMLAALRLAEQHPESPRPHELLAALAAADGDAGRALERWEEAAERSSENGYVYVQGARAKLVDLGFTADPDERLSDEEAAEARRWLDRAGTMYPLFDDAFETLALVEARAPQFRPPVVNLLQNRVPLFKDPNPTLLALAMIRWRARDEATSESILAAVLADPRTRPETRAAARYLQIRFFGERMLPAAP